MNFFFFLFFQVAATSFAIFVFTGNVLTASKAFVALSLFNVMRFPLVMLPDVIVTCIRVSTCSSYVYVHLHFHTEPGLGWGWLEDKGIVELITVLPKKKEIQHLVEFVQCRMGMVPKREW